MSFRTGLPSFTYFYPVLPSFTQFYLVLPSIRDSIDVWWLVHSCYPVFTEFVPLIWLWRAALIVFCFSCSPWSEVVLEFSDILPEGPKSYDKMEPPKKRGCHFAAHFFSVWLIFFLCFTFYLTSAPLARAIFLAPTFLSPVDSTILFAFVFLVCVCVSGNRIVGQPTVVEFHVTVMSLDSIDESSMVCQLSLFVDT